MPDTFTPEQIAQILEAFFDTVGTRQYIGARYVPIFGRKDEDSIIWDNSAPYEPLTIVLYQGNSFTSRQYVPTGVDISNQEFWANTGNYNAQVEQYRQEVAAFDTRITQNTNDISTLLPKSAFSSSNTVKDYIDDASDAITDVIGTRFTDQATITAFADSVDDTLSTYQDKMLVIGDSYSDYELSGDRTSDSSLWWYKLANWLNLTPTKYAKSGAGYVHASDGITFDTLADRAISEVTDKEKYKYVFVYGGLNDIRLDVTLNDLDAALKIILPKIRAAFPKSIAIVMGCNTFVNQNINAYGATQPEFTRKISEIANASGCAFIKTDTWLLGWTSQFNDVEHPNQYAEDRIAAFVARAMFGNAYDAGLRRGSIRESGNWSITNVNRIEANCSIITADTLYLNVTLEVTTQPSGSNLPSFKLPWNLSTGYTLTTSKIVAPVIMRVGTTFYNSLYAVVNKGTVTINAQTWPEIGNSSGHIYLDMALPLVVD